MRRSAQRPLIVPFSRKKVRGEKVQIRHLMAEPQLEQVAA